MKTVQRKLKELLAAFVIEPLPLTSNKLAIYRTEHHRYNHLVLSVIRMFSRVKFPFK
jgi:hypothetical protein